MAPDPSTRLFAVPSIDAIPPRLSVCPGARLPAQHTPFVGRVNDLADLRALLSRNEVRLLTLTGPGGIGKTRLAVRVAEELAASLEDRVAFVALAGVREPAHTLPTIYQALGGRETGSDFTVQRLYHLLEDGARLLLLDNVEHLVTAAAAISDVLTACPRLKIIVTSLSALRLSGEHEYLVSPLTLPDLAPHATADQIFQSDAVRLFVQRAGAVRPGFAATVEELSAVGEICHRLEGLPLAIELAAVRVTHLSAQALLGQLDRPGGARLPLLTGGLRDQPARHQTLRDTIFCSYDLLDDRERTAFQRLSVFVDGFSVAAAGAVCELDESGALDRIGSLIVRSLVRYEGDWGGEPRYRMFETIREFGLEQLLATGEEAGVRQRHAAWALALAEQGGPKVKGPEAAVWLETLERDRASLHSALAWLVEQGEGERLTRMAGALWPFWEEHAHYAEGRRWLETALELGGAAPARQRLHLLTGAGTMARHQADFDHGLVRHEEALLLAKELDDREAEATAHYNIGAQFMDLGIFDEARVRFEACQTHACEVGLPHLVIGALSNLGQIQRVQHDSAAALQSLEEALVQAHQRDLTWLLPSIQGGLALTATDLGDFERAIGLFHESLTQAVAQGHLGHVIDAIEGLARLAAVTGQAERSVRLYSAGGALRDKLTFPLSPTEVVYAEPIMRVLQEALGAASFAAAWADGQSLSQEQAIEEALAVRSRPVESLPLSTGSRSAPFCLTERELEVLRLLAAGHRNSEVGDALFISPATAARHVSNIYSKLGVDSRARAAAFAHQHGLV